MKVYSQRYSASIRILLLIVVLFALALNSRSLLTANEHGDGDDETGALTEGTLTETMRAFLKDREPPHNVPALSDVPCVGGMAGIYPCDNVHLLSHIPLATFGATAGNDSWGWTDPLDGKEYAIMGLNNGTGFVDISDPINPIYLGKLPTQTVNSSWRDIKVYNNYAFIVSEATNHGMQVFDLTELRNVISPPVTFVTAAHYNSFGRAHNIAINEDSGFAYAVGSTTCSGGLHMVNIQNPTLPAFAGCFSSDGYTHDAQCVIYSGPDINYQGQEICFNSNANTLTIVDVTIKNAPVQLSRTGYPNHGYTHQGWLTEDQVYFLLDDELDESNFGHNTRTRIWDVSNLAAPVLIGFHDSTVAAAIDHNLYTLGNYVYQANYRAGLRILDMSDISNANLTEVAYFDIYPANDNPNFNGAWNTFPYYESGVVIISGIEQGLFVVQPVLEPPAVYGLELSGDQAAVGVPGATLTYTVSITNTGNVSDTFDLSFAGNDWNTSLPDDSITLQAAESGQFSVMVTIPPTAVSGDSDEVLVTATSAGDPDQSATTLLATTAISSYGVALSGDMAEAGFFGTTVTYTLSITNTGIESDTFALTIASVWTATPSETGVTLDAGESATLTVSVEIPEDVEAGDSDVATLTAASTADPAISDSAILTTTALSPYGVLLSGDMAETGAVGTTVTYTLLITNSGYVSDTFALSTGENTWTTLLSDTEVSLDVNESTTVTVWVDVPEDALANDSDTVTVTATSSGGPTATAVLTTTAAAFFDVAMGPDAEGSGYAGATVTYTLHITNTGNAADTFNLTAVGNWSATFSTESLLLNAGESTTVTVWVEIPADAMHHSSEIVTVTATSTEDETKSASVALTTAVALEFHYIYLPVVIREN